LVLLLLLVLLVLLLLLLRPARQRRDALIHHDALFDPRPAAQRSHLPGQHQGHRGQADHEHGQYGHHGGQTLADLARRRRVRMVGHGHLGVVGELSVVVAAVFFAPANDKTFTRRHGTREPVFRVSKNGRVSEWIAYRLLLRRPYLQIELDAEY